MKKICNRCLYLLALSVNDPMSYGLPDSPEYNRKKWDEIQDNLAKMGKPHALKDCDGESAARDD